jgi:hypothetical protein
MTMILMSMFVTIRRYWHNTLCSSNQYCLGSNAENIFSVYILIINIKILFL